MTEQAATNIFLLCPNCHRAFASGFAITPGSTMTDCGSECPFCKAAVGIPDITFSQSIASIYRGIRYAPDPRKFAENALAAVRSLQTPEDFRDGDKQGIFARLGLSKPKSKAHAKTLALIIAAIIAVMRRTGSTNHGEVTPQTIVNVYNNQVGSQGSQNTPSSTVEIRPIGMAPPQVQNPQLSATRKSSAVRKDREAIQEARKERKAKTKRAKRSK